MKWIKEFPGGITVCDAQGIILDMNDTAVDIFKNDGGKELIGKNVLDCHPEPSRSKLKQLMDERKQNIYTIEKKGKKKLIYQTPWYENGMYKGLVELSLEIPYYLPNIIRAS
jgi:transcriptional regulator with PAS, ATPase and Fis domain